MKRIFLFGVVSVAIVCAPATSEAVVQSINGQAATAQLLVSPGPNATNTMHMDIVNVGNDTNRFRWDGTPWRVDQGGTGTTTFQKGGVLFYNDAGFLAQNTSSNRGLVWNDTIGRLIIGTSTDTAIGSPGVKLFISGTGQSPTAPTGIVVRNADPSMINGPILQLAGAGGTASSPIPPTTGMVLGTLAFSGYDGNFSSTTPGGFVAGPRAGIRGIAEEDWAPGDNGAGLSFRTTPLGGSNSVERMRLSAAGNLGIATTSPFEALSVNGNAFIDGDVLTQVIQFINNPIGSFIASSGQYAFRGGLSAGVLDFSQIGSSQQNFIFPDQTGTIPLLEGTGQEWTGGQLWRGSNAFSAGPGATTTANFGEIGDASSHACFNTKNTDGNDISFYFVGTSMVVESNLCQ